MNLLINQLKVINYKTDYKKKANETVKKYIHN